MNDTYGEWLMLRLKLGRQASGIPVDEQAVALAAYCEFA
jgi:hypothetical protein